MNEHEQKQPRFNIEIRTSMCSVSPLGSLPSQALNN